MCTCVGKLGRAGCRSLAQTPPPSPWPQLRGGVVSLWLRNDPRVGGTQAGSLVRWELRVPGRCSFLASSGCFATQFAGGGSRAGLPPAALLGGPQSALFWLLSETALPAGSLIPSPASASRDHGHVGAGRSGMSQGELGALRAGLLPQRFALTSPGEAPSLSPASCPAPCPAEESAAVPLTSSDGCGAGG